MHPALRERSTFFTKKPPVFHFFTKTPLFHFVLTGLGKRKFLNRFSVVNDVLCLVFVVSGQLQQLGV